MGTPALPHADNVRDGLAGQVREWFEGRRPAPKALLRGQPGSGKTTVLRGVGDAARALGVPVVEFGPPKLDLDAPVHLLGQGVGALRSAGANGALDPVLDARCAFDEKARRVAGQLRAVDRAVVLLDVPASWTEPGTRELLPLSTRQHALAAVQALAHASDDHALIIATAGETGFLAEVFERGQRKELQPNSEGVAFLRDPDRWGSRFAHSAERLADVLEDDARRVSPLPLRLGVALVFLNCSLEMVADACRLGTYPAAKLFGLEASRRRHLGRALARVALSRYPLSQSALDAALGDLRGSLRRVLTDVVMLEVEGGWVLPPVIRDEAPDLDREEARALHRDLAEQLGSIEANQVSTRREAVAFLEAFHHRALGGDSNGLEDVPDASFLEALGRTLSLRGDYDQAAQAFERALSLDQSRTYAKEYLAFNLERAGRDRPRALRLFAEARQDEPSNPWWNRRHVVALVRRGKLAEAREAMRAALRDVSAADHGRDASWLVRNFHAGVALAFLERGDLDAAAEVLRAVRTELMQDEPELLAIRNALKHRQEAARLETAFFPESVPFDGRWAGPHLADPDDAAEIQHWYPGRIAAIAEDSVVLDMARPPSGEDDAEPFELELSREEFLEVSQRRGLRGVHDGQFVELLVFNDGTQLLVIQPRESGDRAKDPSDLLHGWNPHAGGAS